MMDRSRFRVVVFAVLVSVVGASTSPARADDATLKSARESLQKAEKSLAAGNAGHAKVYLANAKRDLLTIENNPAFRKVKASPEFAAVQAKVPAVEKQVEAANDVVSDGCKRTLDFSLSVVEREHLVFTAEGAKRVRAWDMRNSLERARWTLVQPPENKGQALPQICTAADRKRPDFAPLDARFKKAEAMVVEVETAKDLRWAGFTRHSGMTWLDAKTGKEIPNSQEVF